MFGLFILWSLDIVCSCSLLLFGGRTFYMQTAPPSRSVYLIFALFPCAVPRFRVQVRKARDNIDMTAAGETGLEQTENPP